MCSAVMSSAREPREAKLTSCACASAVSGLCVRQAKGLSHLTEPPHCRELQGGSADLDRDVQAAVLALHQQCHLALGLAGAQ